MSSQDSEVAAQTPSPLPVDAVARCTREAQRDGIFAGVTSGLASVILGSKVFRLNRNATILCGVVTGVLAGYQFTQAFLSSNLARLKAEQEKQPTSDTPLWYVGKAKYFGLRTSQI
ncbi:hypothetical protein A0H81_00253 [Grifola frondosa]|uniref:Uncharacterized protein n=1 Tax=Grifola frondosa TaxID=5627 RepID=A0A1C7MPR4_GRIFR|nr:hypothetical protein A0H81_00253 [Grifola frondosa]